jgi:sugar lactone lactonase YvrE
MKKQYTSKRLILLIICFYFNSITIKAQITEVISGLSSPYGLAIDQASNLYISESGTTNGNKISMMFLADQVPAVFDLFTTNLNTPTRLKIADNYLYVVETGSNQISRFNMLVAPPQMLPYITSGLTGPIGLDVQNNILYIGDYGSYAIRKINTNVIPFQTSVINQDLATDIVVDGEFFYYANPDYGKVYVNTLLNPSPIGGVIATGIVSPSSLLMHENVLYISDKNQGKIYRFNPDGASTESQEILTGLNQPQSMVVYNNYLYIAEMGANRIVKFDLSNLNTNTYEENFIVTIAPNPAQNKIHVQTQQDIKEIRVFNILGQQVRTTLISNSVEISDLDVGIYLIQIITKNNKVLVSKFIKN